MSFELDHEVDRRACDLAQNLLCMVYQRLEATAKKGVITRNELDDIFCELLPCTEKGKQILKELT